LLVSIRQLDTGQHSQQHAAVAIQATISGSTEPRWPMHNELAHDEAWLARPVVAQQQERQFVCFAVISSFYFLMIFVRPRCIRPIIAKYSGLVELWP